MPSTTKSRRSRSDSRQREFVRQFVEGVRPFELEVASMPRRQHLSFFLPISGSASGDVKLLAVGFHIRRTSQIGKVILISDQGTLTSSRVMFRLLRVNKPLIHRWEAFRILFDRDGPIHNPVVWRVRLAKPADFGHQVDPAPSISIEATGAWMHRVWGDRLERYTVRYSLSLEAEPNPRVYLLISIDDEHGNIWTAHSQWVPLTRAGWSPDPQILLEDNDGKARNQS
jgi:hypothetical protein